MPLTLMKFDNKDLNISLDAYVDNKQNIWFKGKEVATLFGYKDTDNAIRKHVKDFYKKKIIIPVNRRGNPQTIFISEPCL